MALTAFQSEVLRLLADNRRNNPESYVAGGLALNYTLGTPRVSRDVDVFHDSVEALAKSWIDVITCFKYVQPLAFLLCAACGKDPGFSPSSMLEYIARRRYSQVEIDGKIVPHDAYDAASLSRSWHEEIDRTRGTLSILPREAAGKAVLTKDGELFRGTDAEFQSVLAAGEIVFHEGHLGGAWPRIVER